MTTTHDNNSNIPEKKFPTTTSEVAKMLGIEGNSNDLPLGTFNSGHNLPIANLPVVGVDHATSTPSSHDAVENAVHSANAHTLLEEEDVKPASKVLSIAKAVGPYVAVFTVGLVLYSFFFTGFNFSSLINSKPKATTTKQTAVQELAAQNSASFQKWIAGFYYDVTDPKLLDPENDNSGNGLSNFQKYLLKLNPKAYDTLGLGTPDSQTLASGIDPATGAPLTDIQKDIISKYIDMEVVMNRFALSRLHSLGAVAGAGVNGQQTVTNSPFLGTNVNNPQTQTIPIPNTNTNLIGNGIEINTDIPGRLEIPSLKVNAPIIFSKDPKNFDKDLQIGVVHYPGTALPGQIGTTYISGHSSNYVWAKGDYNRVFTKLGDLADNTSFKITVVQKNGKDAIFHYVVTRRSEYLATDQEQFRNTGKSVVALSTCWPINTTAKRLVVFGELTQTEK